jgi:hypothetical protein
MAIGTAGSGELQRQLAQVAKFFDIDPVLDLPADRAAVIDYYTRSRDLSRRVHSASGAIHIALSTGAGFQPDGYYGQVKLVEQQIAARRPGPRARARLRHGVQQRLPRRAPSGDRLLRARHHPDPSA